MFKCQECGRKFSTAKAAEKATNLGCPKCGGVDIDLDCPADRHPIVEIRREIAHAAVDRLLQEEPKADTAHPKGL